MGTKKRIGDNRKSGNLPPLQPIMAEVDEEESPTKHNELTVEEYDSKIECDLLSIDQRSSAIDLNNELHQIGSFTA